MSQFGAVSLAKFQAELLAHQAGKMKALSKTWWVLDHLRKGKMIDRQIASNLLLTEGANFITGLGFAASPPTAISAWYIVLFENDYTPVAGDAYASNGWTELTAYDESTRPVWTPGSVAGGSVDNSANKATFTINASKTIYGGVLLGGGSTPSTKSDTAGGGTAYAGVRFASSRAVISGDVLKVTAIVTISDDPT